MKNESRQSRRITDFIPVSVYVAREGSDDFLAGPYHGTVVDICRAGACLLMSSVTRNSFHVYHSTRKAKAAYLNIRIDSHPDLTGRCMKARPVWLNTFQREDFRERMIGVEFLADAQRLRGTDEQLDSL